MVKLVARIKKVVYAAMIWTFSSCFTTGKFNRVAPIPDTADWLGGMHGGSWIDIVIGANNEITVDVYASFPNNTANKIGSYQYKNECSDKKINKRKIMNAIDFADGTILTWLPDKEIAKCFVKIQ